MEKIPCDHNRAEKQNNIPPDIASDTIQNKNRKKNRKAGVAILKHATKRPVIYLTLNNTNWMCLTKIQYKEMSFAHTILYSLLLSNPARSLGQERNKSYIAWKRRNQAVSIWKMAFLE